MILEDYKKLEKDTLRFVASYCGCQYTSSRNKYAVFDGRLFNCYNLDANTSVEIKVRHYFLKDFYRFGGFEINAKKYKALIADRAIFVCRTQDDFFVVFTHHHPVTQPTYEDRCQTTASDIKNYAKSNDMRRDFIFSDCVLNDKFYGTTFFVIRKDSRRLNGYYEYPLASLQGFLSL